MAPVILLFAVLALTLTPALTPASNAESISGWSSTTSYPNSHSIGFEPCIIHAGYIYCITGSLDGSSSNAVYSATVGSGSIGTWNPQSSFYPSLLSYVSCVEDSGYITCVGGFNGGSSYDYVNYASISSGSVGPWTGTVAYGASGGTNVFSESCVTYNGYIDCVGGANSTGSMNEVYYASLNNGAISGSWTRDASYGIAVDNLSCVVYNGYVYCVGGYTGSAQTNQVWYAQLGPSGGITGSWMQTTDYGSATGGDTSGNGGVATNLMSCAVSGGYDYCVGGTNSTTYSDAVYYAQLSSSGVGAWHKTSDYGAPTDIEGSGCATDSGYIYCVGGYNGGYQGAAYSAQVASPVPVFPYGVIPFLLVVPALYYLITRKPTGKTLALEL